MEILVDWKAILVNWPGFGAFDKAWMPLFQSLVWPAFTALFLVWRHKEVRRIFVSAALRIEQGDGFEAAGVRLEASQPKLSPTPTPTPTATPTSTPSPTPASSSPMSSTSPPSRLRPRSQELDVSSFFLIHSARRDPRIDKDGKEYYRIKIWVDADYEELLLDIASVTYYLHPSFQDPVRKFVDFESKFELRTQAWGQFNLFAIIQFKDTKQVRIERYINF